MHNVKVEDCLAPFIWLMVKQEFTPSSSWTILSGHLIVNRLAGALIACCYFCSTWNSDGIYVVKLEYGMVVLADIQLFHCC